MTVWTTRLTTSRQESQHFPSSLASSASQKARANLSIDATPKGHEEILGTLRMAATWNHFPSSLSPKLDERNTRVCHDSPYQKGDIYIYIYVYYILTHIKYVYYTYVYIYIHIYTSWYIIYSRLSQAQGSWNQPGQYHQPIWSSFAI